MEFILYLADLFIYGFGAGMLIGSGVGKLCTSEDTTVTVFAAIEVGVGITILSLTILVLRPALYQYLVAP